jgi:hypothetical protein
MSGCCVWQTAPGLPTFVRPDITGTFSPFLYLWATTYICELCSIKSTRFGKLDHPYQHYNASGGLLPPTIPRHGCDSGQYPSSFVVVVLVHQHYRPCSIIIPPYIRIGILGANIHILKQYKALSFSVHFPDESGLASGCASTTCSRLPQGLC